MGEMELTTYDLDRMSGVLKTARTMDEKAIVMERELGMDPIYALVAIGTKPCQIAASLGLGTFELNYILRRTPDARKRYMEASAFSMAEESQKTLSTFQRVTNIDLEESSALRFHSSNIDRYVKLMSQPNANDVAGQIVVNNTVVVRDSNDVPPLPEELNAIMDVDHVDIE